MTKQEQIEEIAKIIDEMYWVYDTTAGDIAEGIYNAGYRKTFTNEMVSDTQKAFKEGYEKGCETCGQAWDNGYNDGFEDGKEQAYKDCYDITRKETAKEILSRIKLYATGSKTDLIVLIDEIAKANGVEVNE